MEGALIYIMVIVLLTGVMPHAMVVGHAKHKVVRVGQQEFNTNSVLEQDSSNIIN